MATDTTNGTPATAGTTGTASATAGTLNPEEHARLAELAGLIRTAVESIATAARTTLEDGHKAGVWLQDCFTLCEKGGLKWGQWVKVNTTITQQYANKLKKLADPAGWAKVEAALAARTSGDRPLTITDAVRIASGSGGQQKARRATITMDMLEPAIVRSRLKAIGLTAAQVKTLLKELGIEVKKAKKKTSKAATA